MAESGSPSKSGTPPPPSAAPPDWEVLTISMSASALGKPHGEDLDNVSEVSNAHIERSSNPSLNEGAFASDVWTDSLHASATRDVSTDVEAEPFTEGWKPHLCTSSSLCGYVAEQNHQEDSPLPGEGAETYFDSNASMNMPEGLIVREKDGDGDDVEKKLLSYNHSVDGKWHKRPKKSTTLVWSIALVASVAGIVFIGNRLRLAYYQNQQLEIQLSAKDEKLNEILLQVNRLKEVLGNHHRVPVSRN